MKENTVTSYTCEICGHPWSVKEFAEKCEAIGYPENYDKLLGKWIIVPASVYFSKETAPGSFDFSPQKLWRVVRIDSNYITNLGGGFAPAGTAASQEQLDKGTDDKTKFEKQYADQILKLHHRLVVQCKGFEDNSRVESLKTFFDVPEGMFESLNGRLVEMELERKKDKEEAAKEFGEQMTNFVAQFFTSDRFEKKQHEIAEQVLQEVLAKVGEVIGELPVIEKEELPSITVQGN